MSRKDQNPAVAERPGGVLGCGVEPLRATPFGSASGFARSYKFCITHKGLAAAGLANKSVPCRPESDARLAWAAARAGRTIRKPPVGAIEPIGERSPQRRSCRCAGSLPEQNTLLDLDQLHMLPQKRLAQLAQVLPVDLAVPGGMPCPIEFDVSVSRPARLVLVAQRLAGFD